MKHGFSEEQQCPKKAPKVPKITGSSEEQGRIEQTIRKSESRMRKNALGGAAIGPLRLLYDWNAERAECGREERQSKRQRETAIYAYVRSMAIGEARGREGERARDGEAL